jgi:methylmalonyl-CoA mutase cobalamin-binding subunit
MALGLDMEWLFRAHVEANRRLGTRVGWNTRNLPFLVDKLGQWGISLEDAVIATPFNAAGFQMCPSREACEETLAGLPESTDLIGFSVLAAGHMSYAEAIDYVARQPGLAGVAVGVSKPEQASSTFRDLRQAFERVAV